jgi:hypothetical protein
MYLGHTKHTGRPEISNPCPSIWHIPILLVLTLAFVFGLTHIWYLSTLSGSLLSSTFTYIYLFYKVVTPSSGSCVEGGNCRGADGGIEGDQLLWY